jgi:hypothetical protein
VVACLRDRVRDEVFATPDSRPIRRAPPLTRVESGLYTLARSEAPGHAAYMHDGLRRRRARSPARVQFEEHDRSDPVFEQAHLQLQARLYARLSSVGLGYLFIFGVLLCDMYIYGVLMLPFLFIGVAVYAPAGPPSDTTRLATGRVTACFALCGAIELRTACKRFAEATVASGNFQQLHYLRTAIPLFFGIATLFLAYDNERWRAVPYWSGIRSMITVGSVLRLLVNWRMRHLDAPADGYLPGNMDYTASVAINVGHIVLFAFLLTRSRRDRLSKHMGRAITTVSLAELPPIPSDRGRGCQSLMRSSKSTKSSAVESDRLLSSAGSDAAELHKERPPALEAEERAEERAEEGSAGPRRRTRRSSRASSARSTISSAASELARHDLGEGSTAAHLTAQGEAIGCPPYPWHRLLPQFHRDTAEYLDPATSASLLLQVCDGRLVDCDGQLLAPDGEEEAMYVMDVAGDVYTTIGFEGRGGAASRHGSLHHSSLVAGEPVTAAGMMTVDRGWLISLSNESGHYAPPPSSLSSMMHRLNTLGAERLGEVTLEIVRRREYEVVGQGSPPGQARASAVPRHE